MDDNSIVTLYWKRDESAITQTAEKYGPYCQSIACRILHNIQDAEEVVNDTYSAAWNSIPPHRPAVLATFLGKITRRLSLKLWRARNTQKRGVGETALAFDELDECIPDGRRIDEGLEEKELVRILDEFLLGLSPDERHVFIRRYWHFLPISALCEQFGFSRSKVESMLHRTRKKLLLRLKKEGVFV